MGTQSTYCSLICIISIANSQQIGCSSISGDTCYIEAISAWKPADGDFICDSTYQNCHVNCIGSNSCSGQGTHKPTILCSTNCTINCIGLTSCTKLNIDASNNLNTYLNINSSGNSEIKINGPGTNGALFIKLTDENAEFFNSEINAQSQSSIIDINCNDGKLCNNLVIDGRYIENEINFRCDNQNVSCQQTEIYCSDDMKIINNRGICNINCSFCSSMNVYSMQGIVDVNWNCNDQRFNACLDSNIHCIPIYGTEEFPLYQYSNSWQYVDNQWNWDGLNCTTC